VGKLTQGACANCCWSGSGRRIRLAVDAASSSTVGGLTETPSPQLLSIQQVVKSSGASSRTLRHSDDIGLLSAATTASGAIRMYGHAELLRLQRNGKMNREQAVEISKGFEVVESALTELLRANVAVDDQRVQLLIDKHSAIVAQFWTPDAQSYAGLGQMYVDTPDFRARYDAYDPGLAEFKRDAMEVYANTNLT